MSSPDMQHTRPYDQRSVAYSQCPRCFPTMYASFIHLLCPVSTADAGLFMWVTVTSQKFHNVASKRSCSLHSLPQSS